MKQNVFQTPSTSGFREMSRLLAAFVLYFSQLEMPKVKKRLGNVAQCGQSSIF